MSLTSRANAVIGQLPYNSADLAGCPLNETTQKKRGGGISTFLVSLLPTLRKKTESFLSGVQELVTNN